MFNNNKVLWASFVTSMIMFVYLGALAAKCFSLWLIIPCAIYGLYACAFVKINRDKFKN